jgi:hypothetical protein
MCVLGLGALVGLTGAGAAGAGAAATGAVGALQTLATVASIGGTIYSGISAYQTGKAQEAALTQQAETEARLTAAQDQRQRGKMQSVIRQQGAEIMARGIDLSSPTAVYLGQTAAQELSFDSQAIRSGGAARVAELSSQAKIARAGATAGLVRGAVGAASDFLTMGPDVWPGLFRERQLA